ncbi:hypothetical protein FisN_18Hu145 [Fistulifera solaris]|uniref:VWFD domain-containing protein n=1 Tax=Fistulifera solaris TaxID=1519565 RepID=A0A1Z5JV81_FISSO|nr:hypothetical protein FisN_18Hu145 [Fistulifera solaris]|eukprot:GAX17937.1 hypothetical protein FisN_18Hu145 [Fistulifera solaris]
MKVFNSFLAVVALLSCAADAESVERNLGKTIPKMIRGQACKVRYNTNADKYMPEKDFECDTGLVCAELNDSGVDGVVFTGVCSPESCDGTADPSKDQPISSHRVTICHRTCSETNPWVRITIDDDAWGGAEASGCGHQREHNVTEDCKKDDYSAWGPNRVDYLIKDHGTRSDVRIRNSFTPAEEKAYWFHWERACPYVRAKKLNKPCCDWEKGECCGPHPDDKCPMDPDKTAPGQCGCGVPDTDTDQDGVADCLDPCPTNAAVKTEADLNGCTCGDTAATIAAGCGAPEIVEVPPCPVCGCGSQDIDSDGDGTLDCFDVCPNDASKTTSAGHCGCGVSEVDSDGDGTPDCKDLCPQDKDKLSPGTCGCGVSDKDSDADGTPDCNDKCPMDNLKLEPGICGCGISDCDTDGDGVPDCMDGCSRDATKTEEGVCGCGVSDVDTDGDGTPDCNDACQDDPSKTEPGLCGCGKADSDNDGTCDANDQCPMDPNKNQMGLCGCGVGETDSDLDGTPDCVDGCSLDSTKVTPGICGCGMPDTDSDNDGTPDCNDGCSTDSTKIAPGVCGCGTPDVDSDGDGTPDCLDECPQDDCKDLCPNDIYKTEPGSCGCNKQDTDADNDGTPDCNDLCPLDPTMTTDVDTDGDGTLDCNDGCSEDPEKIAPGECGCGFPDEDSDGDGVMDCNEVREDITLTSSNLIGTTETYKECYKMYNAGNSDPNFSGYVEAATAYCLADCVAGAYCIKVQAASGIQLADKEAWFKDYSVGTSSLQPLAPGIKLTYEQGKVIAWEGCFEIPEGATGENIEIHANWGYTGSKKLGNTASTGKPNGVVMDYPECLSTETTPLTTPVDAPADVPVEAPVESPVELESSPVSSPTGADVDNDPTVGLPTANQVGDGESGGGFGDPHLKTWMGEVYDFHGACDLVLVKTSTFNNGAGLDLHIRTKIRDDWSFISDAAVRIGDDVLEVGTRAFYYLNGVAGAEMPATVGGFPVSLTHFGTRRHKFEIDLGHMGVISIKVFNEFLAVEVNNAHSDGFGDSVGLMGAFTDGSLIGRNGLVHADHNEFGLSWQVHDTDVTLFQKVEGPQYPQLCQMPAPKALKSRRMSEALVSFEDAAKACADWSEETRESCIYDVMSTGDLDMAEAGAF